MIETVEPGYSPDLVEYRTGWELQQRIHDEVVSGARPETLILLEHASVFTAGSRTAQHERPHGGDIPVIDVNRGGKITWHGPGQLVGYPIVRVSRDDVVAYVRRLERMLIELVAAYGIEVVSRATPGDERDAVVAAIDEARAAGVDLVLCTGGMSVDPDDNTPGAIRAAGARVVAYGAPVLPGAMLLVGYFDEPGGRSVPVLGVPGCAMYNKATVLDLILPRLAAGVEVTRSDLVALGEGGLCLGCTECTYPHCPFGR